MSCMRVRTKDDFAAETQRASEEEAGIILCRNIGRLPTLRGPGGCGLLSRIRVLGGFLRRYLLERRCRILCESFYLAVYCQYQGWFSVSGSPMRSTFPLCSGVIVAVRMHLIIADLKIHTRKKAIDEGARANRRESTKPLGNVMMAPSGTRP
jgi:hypothetical protein